MPKTVILTGTDPTSRSGGIGFALPGFLSAFTSIQIDAQAVPTYHPTRWGGRTLLWLRAIPCLKKVISESLHQGLNTVVYSHAGAGASLFRESIVLLAARVFRAKTVMQLHALEIDEYLSTPFRRTLLSWALAPAIGVGVLSEWWYVRLQPLFPNKRLYVIPNPLPEEWERRAREDRINLPKSDGQIRLLALSRLEAGKGFDLIIKSMALLPENVELVVAGSGSQMEALKKQTIALGVAERVTFTGWIGGEEKQRYFNRTDIFCLPTSYDSFGMGFLEAMANGLPVVALKWGAIPDIVPDGRCGLLIERSDPQLLAEAIGKLFDPHRRQVLGINGKKWVLEQFSASKVGGNIQQMLDDIIENTT